MTMPSSVEVTDPKLVGKLNMSGIFGSETPDADKPALKSKKFIAFLITELGLFTLMGLMLKLQDVDKLGSNAAFITLAVTAGFLATGYILGQAALDKYVHAVKVARNQGDNEEENGDEK